ncbi:MAG TPA: cellulose binding domain-containing protein [Polyangiaceae bacterium]
MLSDVRVQLTFGLLLAVTGQACAEGTKVDAGTEPTNGNGGARTASGGTTSDTSGGKASSPRGGNVGLGGTSIKLGSGGSLGTSNPVIYGGSQVSAGGTESSRGTTAQGGDTNTAGSFAIGSGGIASSTVAPPASGLGIEILTQKLNSSGSESATDFALVNKGGTTASLTTLKIRYYFTMDSWTAPVFEIDYAGQIIEKSGVKFNLFTLSPPQADADRYFELTFTLGSLGTGARLQIQSRLHDLQWTPMTVTNDYSFTGAVGFTDRITIYDGTKLVWGVEPGSGSGTGGAGGAGAVGEGGAGGVSGTAATGFAGALVTGQGGVENTTTMTGAAGIPSSVATAGSAGAAESIEFAGAAGSAGSN